MMCAYGFVKVEGDKFVFSDAPQREVKIKGTNFQTPHHPWNTFGAWDLGEIKRCMDAAQALGMNAIRAGFPSSPHADIRHRVDKFVELANERGMRVYFVPHWPARFAEPGTRGDSLNKDFIKSVLEDFATHPGIFAWDLMNEPDWIDHQHWHWGQAPSEAFRRIGWFARMADYIRSFDANHPISVGVIFANAYWLPKGSIKLLDVVDFVDFHFYHRNYRLTTLREQLREVRKKTSKPILNGEIGISTDPSYRTAGEPLHSEEIQRRVYREYISNIKELDTSGFLQWTLCDYCDVPRDFGENFYGILRADFTPKPAAHVVREDYLVEPFTM